LSLSLLVLRFTPSALLLILLLSFFLYRSLSYDFSSPSSPSFLPFVSFILLFSFIVSLTFYSLLCRSTSFLFSSSSHLFSPSSHPVICFIFINQISNIFFGFHYFWPFFSFSKFSLFLHPHLFFTTLLSLPLLFLPSHSFSYFCLLDLSLLLSIFSSFYPFSFSFTLSWESGFERLLFLLSPPSYYIPSLTSSLTLFPHLSPFIYS
jgi:hypothetical protein